jgi:hypothetical protein
MILATLTVSNQQELSATLAESNWTPLFPPFCSATPDNGGGPCVSAVHSTAGAPPTSVVYVIDVSGTPSPLD